MRHADVAHIAAASRGAYRLRHRLLSADALEHRVSANTASQFFRRHVRGSHEGPFRERHPQHGRLRAADKFAVLAGRLVAELAVWTSIVGGKKRADDKLARLDLRHGTTDVFDDAAVLVPHRSRVGDGLNA